MNNENENNTATAPTLTAAAVSQPHFTWSTESPTMQCPYCAGVTMLIVAQAWEMDSESDHEETGEWIELHEEISGHWCPECRKLTSLSFNP